MKKNTRSPTGFIFISMLIFVLCGAAYLMLNAQHYERLWASNLGLSVTLGIALSEIMYMHFSMAVLGILFGVIFYISFVRKGAKAYLNSYQPQLETAGAVSVAGVTSDIQKDKGMKFNKLLPHRKRSKAFSSQPINVYDLEKEEAKIYKKIQLKKQMARDMKIPELFTALYHEQIKHYPIWIDSDADRKRICPLVTSAAKLDDDSVKIILNGTEYILSFKTERKMNTQGRYSLRGVMEMSYNDKTVLRLNMINDSSVVSSSWNISDIEAFVEGDWINDFQQLQQYIEGEVNNGKLIKKQDKIAKIKSDFGLD